MIVFNGQRESPNNLVHNPNLWRICLHFTELPSRGVLKCKPFLGTVYQDYDIPLGRTLRCLIVLFYLLVVTINPLLVVFSNTTGIDQIIKIRRTRGVIYLCLLGLIFPLLLLLLVIRRVRNRDNLRISFRSIHSPYSYYSE